MLVVRKYIYFTWIIFLFAWLLFVNGCNQKKSDKIVAKVGEYDIMQSDFVERYEDFLIQTGIKDNFPSRKQVVNSMIAEVLLGKYDDNKSITSNKEYIIEKKWLKDQAVLTYLKDQEVYAKINVTDKETRNAFLRSNQKLNVSHLYAATESEINELYQLLQIGVSFETLAKQTFTDSTLRNNGGNLGFITWGDMEPEFEEKAYSMKVGEISKPIKTKHGFSIIKLNKKVTRPLLTENEYLNKKDKFKQVIRLRKRKPAEKLYVNSIVNFEEIKFNKKAIDEIWQSVQLKINRGLEKISNKNLLEKCIEYKNTVYSIGEVLKEINAIPTYHLVKIKSEENLKTVMKGIVLKDRLKKIADEKGYTTNKYVLKKYNKMKTNLFMKYKISEIIKDANIPDSLVFGFYKKHPDFFSTHNKMNVQEILVKEKQLAKTILNKIRNGAKFSVLAKKYSKRKLTAERGGVIGLAPVAKYGSLKDLFWGSKINKILGPIKVNNYYGIFKVIAKEKSKPVSFEKAKNIAEMAVKFKLKNELLKKYIEKLKTKTKVEVFDKIIGSTKILAISNK